MISKIINTNFEGEEKLPNEMYDINKYENVEFLNFASWLIVISRQTTKMGNKVNVKCTKKTATLLRSCF